MCVSVYLCEQASPRKPARASKASAEKTKKVGVSPRFVPSSVLGWAGSNIVLAGARYPVIIIYIIILYIIIIIFYMYSY